VGVLASAFGRLVAILRRTATGLVKPESLRQILIVLQVFINKSLKWFLPLIDISLYAESDGQ